MDRKWDAPGLRAAQVEPHVGRGVYQARKDVVAARAAQHDSRGALINAALGEGCYTTAFDAGQPRCGDIESKHVGEGAAAALPSTCAGSVIVASSLISRWVRTARSG